MSNKKTASPQQPLELVQIFKTLAKDWRHRREQLDQECEPIDTIKGFLETKEGLNVWVDLPDDREEVSEEEFDALDDHPIEHLFARIEEMLPPPPSSRRRRTSSPRNLRP